MYYLELERSRTTKLTRFSLVILIEGTLYTIKKAHYYTYFVKRDGTTVYNKKLKYLRNEN